MDASLWDLTACILRDWQLPWAELHGHSCSTAAFQGEQGHTVRKVQGTAAELSEVKSALHQQGISSCYNSLHTVIKHAGMAVTGKTARYLPAVCLVLASAVKSLAFTSNTLFHPSLS